MKIPEGYLKLVEKIESNEIEVVDLTGSELGESCLLYIIEKLNSKVKNLKLTKNKITDDFLAHIIQFLDNIVVLNLGSNQLSEKCLDILIENRGELTNIKNIVLTQNKIPERRNKAKLEKLRGSGVIINI